MLYYRVQLKEKNVLVLGNLHDMMIKFNKSKEVIHIGFEIGLLLKGLDGLFEVIGGALLTFLNPQRMSYLMHILTQHELSEDPNDMIANYLVALGHSFSISTQQFGVIYLMSHGIIKLILILLLWRRKLWAYPLSILFLVLFIIYQIYRYTLTYSVFLILLTFLDAAMIVLTYLEYRRIQSSEAFRGGKQ